MSKTVTPAGAGPVDGTVRPDGWYWVRKDGWYGEVPAWTPAEWRQESRAWYSSKFSGIPDSGIVQHGPALKPLTRQQIDDVMTEHYPLDSLLRENVDAFEACVREIERRLGIGA
jgi:hypothetical protein